MESIVLRTYQYTDISEKCTNQSTKKHAVYMTNCESVRKYIEFEEMFTKV